MSLTSMFDRMSKWRTATTSAAMMLALSACATAPATMTPETRAPEIVVRRVVIDVSALFPAESSRTVVDRAAVKPGLLARIALERAALTGTDGVDPWLARALFAHLVKRGGVVSDDVTDATARLTGVRFAQGDDEISVIVVKEDDAFLVRHRVSKDDETMCEPDLKVKVGYVQFEATVVDEAHRVVAEIAEVVVAVPSDPRVAIDIIDEDDVCARLGALLLDELAPGERELEHAAHKALTTGLAVVAEPL